MTKIVRVLAGLGFALAAVWFCAWQYHDFGEEHTWAQIPLVFTGLVLCVTGIAYAIREAARGLEL